MSTQDHQVAIKQLGRQVTWSISCLILEQKNAWKELYDPSRKNLKAIKTFTEENLNTFAQYRDWLTSGESEGTMQPNTGKIVRKGMKKVAVFCDAQGKCRSFSAVCPHLGGIVRWNSAEKTWDCPCHGSRFTAHGKPINGPANRDLD